jgi:hypothetical protein
MPGAQAPRSVSSIHIREVGQGSGMGVPEGLMQFDFIAPRLL